MKLLARVGVLSLCTVLTACSAHTKQTTLTEVGTENGEIPVGVNTVAGVQIGGSIGRSMDAFDRVKLNRALDKAPGASTTWMNQANGTSYTVTPIRKLTINGNRLCRQYQVEATRGGNKQQVDGSACVAPDGAWSEVSSS